MPRTLLPNEVFGNSANSGTPTNAGTGGGRGVSRPTYGRRKITAPTVTG